MKIKSIESLLSDRRVVLAINAALGLLLIIAALLAARNITSGLLSPKKRVVREAQKAEPAKARAFEDYAPILRDNPFGPPAGELTQLSAAASQAGGVAAIDITLIGTVAGTRKFSYAIFADKAGKQEVFAVGDPVFGIGSLKEVRKDSVVIDSAGKPIEIELSDVTKVELAKAGAAAGQPGFATRTGELTYTIDQQRVQQAIDNPRQIMTDARLLPNMVSGKQEGFTINEVKAGGIYSSLGLQNGDILLRINELEISSPEAALQAFTALRGLDRIQLDIMRGGAKMTLSYQIR